MCVIDFIMFEMEVLVCSHQTDFQTDLILTRPLQSPTFLRLPTLFLSFSSLTKVVFPNLLLPASCLIFTLSTLFFLNLFLVILPKLSFWPYMHLLFCSFSPDRHTVADRGIVTADDQKCSFMFIGSISFFSVSMWFFFFFPGSGQGPPVGQETQDAFCSLRSNGIICCSLMLAINWK